MRVEFAVAVEQCVNGGGLSLNFPCVQTPCQYYIAEQLFRDGPRKEFSCVVKRSEPTTIPADIGVISRSSLKLSFVFETRRLHENCHLRAFLPLQTSSIPRPAMASTNTPLSPPLAEDTTATSRNVSL